MIFQDPTSCLNPVFTIGEQIAETLRREARHVGGREARARAVELLDRVGHPVAASAARAYPHQLSGGMRQRVMIAIAIACRPKLLLADEPTTALDVTIQDQILALLAELQDEYGMAMILVSHDLGVVAENCDSVAVMYAGRVVEDAPTAALPVAAATRTRARLIPALPSIREPAPRRGCRRSAASRPTSPACRPAAPSSRAAVAAATRAARSTMELEAASRPGPACPFWREITMTASAVLEVTGLVKRFELRQIARRAGSRARRARG